MLLLLACTWHPLGSWVPAETDAPMADERIAVTPAELDFGQLSVLEDGAASTSFTIYNLSDEAITLSGQDEVLGGGPFEVEAEAILVLEPGFEVSIPVRFAPPTEGVYGGDIAVQPGQEVVHLVGAATSPVLRAGDVSFAAVVLGCSGVGTVELRNEGSEPARLSTVEVSAPEFEVLGYPDTIEADGTGTVEVRFTPPGGGQRGATLSITSNDPATPELPVQLSVLGYEGERVTESFRYTPANPTDILFVVDTGATMTDALAASTAAQDAFIDTLRSANIDYHLASVGAGGPCPGESPPYATRSDSTLQSSAVLARGFEAGTGTWENDLLGLALVALEESTTGGCLAGFRRADADLHVVLLADGPSTADVGAQVDTLGFDADLRVSGLIPDTTDCGSLAPDYGEAIDRTGGTRGDLCDAAWSADFEAFATLPPGADAVSYPLRELPVPTSLEVRVEGEPFEDWVYDPVENAVYFNGAVVPALGAEVVIEYVLAVACQ